MGEWNKANRHEVILSPEAIKHFDLTASAWHETPEEIEAGLAWGREKAVLLRWVRRQMKRRLTACERRCLELYFFKGMTYREMAACSGRNVTSAYRAVQRSLRKLRAAIEEGDAPRLRRNRRAP